MTTFGRSKHAAELLYRLELAIVQRADQLVGAGHCTICS
jgi:hypothetical protein